MSNDAQPFNTLLKFSNLSALIAAEKCCQEMGVVYQIEPLPPTLTSDCGMCIALNRAWVDPLLRQLQRLRINCTTHERDIHNF